MGDPSEERQAIVESVDLVVDDSDDGFDAEAVRRAVAEESYGVSRPACPTGDDW